ncbi:hypothetical protein K523DRAFT_411496 [Schizophyllum commune Tattone D]|nr:hypothetical protein K523DRAFT_411496 [Schizophyllum commune Tattone D]
MSKSENDELLNSLSSRIFSLLVDDLVMDAALQAHRDAAKSRAVCANCGTCCSAVRTPGQSGLASPCKASMLSRSGTPSMSDSRGGNGTPGKEGVLYLECVNCQRQIASSRYAPHLSSCMGLSSSRRAAVRGSAKAKQSAERERSLSPGSDVAALSEDSQPLKNKAKSKSKKKDEAEFSLKRKRPTSPQPSPKKPKPKPAGTSAANSPRFKNPTIPPPVSRPASSARLGPHSRRPSSQPVPSASPAQQSHAFKKSQSKVPSKLRESSTVSFERSSSPETSLGSFRSPPMAHQTVGGTWGAAVNGGKGPGNVGKLAGNGGRVVANGSKMAANGRVAPGAKGGAAGSRPAGSGPPKAAGTGPPKRMNATQVRQQVPVPVPVPMPAPAPKPHFAFDEDEGDETGSSTDSSSSS